MPALPDLPLLLRQVPSGKGGLGHEATAIAAPAAVGGGEAAVGVVGVHSAAGDRPLRARAALRAAVNA